MSHAFPAQVLTPRTLAIAAVDLAKLHGTLDCKCMGRVECERRGMGAFLGVSQGSSDEHEAQFIHLTYTKGVPKTRLCVVGKGLTYDSGGYNLKPSAGGSIELMKFDMGGAAATLGCAAAVAELATGQQKGAKIPTSKAPISVGFHSFRLIFGRAIISRNGLEAWMLFPERARAEHSR